MSFTEVAEVQSWLSSAAHLGEAVMRDLRLIEFGYSARVVFDVIVDAQGRVLEEPQEAVFQLEAVHELVLVGALTERMRRHPEDINWGLAEVAIVQVDSDPNGIRVDVLWERDRRVTAVCDRLTVTVGAPGD